jgi:hypothetical protein
MLSEINKDTIKDEDEFYKRKIGSTGELFESDDEITQLTSKDKKKIFSHLEENFPFFKRKNKIVTSTSKSVQNEYKITDYQKMLEKLKMKTTKISNHNYKSFKESKWDIKVSRNKTIKINKITLPKIKQ